MVTNLRNIKHRSKSTPPKPTTKTNSVTQTMRKRQAICKTCIVTALQEVKLLLYLLNHYQKEKKKYLEYTKKKSKNK